MNWATKYFAEYERRKRDEVERAEREAENAGKEPFDLRRLEAALNHGSQAANEGQHRDNYYVLHPEMKTLSEYARFLHRVDPHFFPVTVKRARTVEEMRFAVSLDHCGACRAGPRLAATEIDRGESARTWLCHAKCPACGNERQIEFHSLEDPTRAGVGLFDLGPLRSELISADEFLHVLSEVSPRVHEDAESLRLAIICVLELVKLLPFGADDLPGSTDPRTARSWLYAERVRLRLLWSRSRPPPSLGDDVLAAHGAWLARGAKGPGQLVLSGRNLVSELYGAVDLTFVEIERSELMGIDLIEAQLQYALLEDDDFSFAFLRSAGFSNAAIRRGTWRCVDASSARFDEATVDGTDFSRSDLADSFWRRARVTNARFDGVRFGSAVFDGASFHDCSFVEASFAEFARPEPTSDAARFVDCDFTGTNWKGRHLRATTFTRCKLEGAHGAPASSEALAVEDCDLDRATFLHQLQR